MFSSGPNYTKLKTNLRLAQNRLKLAEKKKTELAQKARKEIADYIAAGKVERARIRVEHIIREDYLVEAMEIVEIYCDLLLARFGLITQMKELDEGIAEAVASLIWVAPRLQADCQEIKVISDILTLKYGKLFAEAAREAQGEHKVSPKLMQKMAIQAPPKLLVEKYLIEIAKVYDIEYEPDPQVMSQKDGVLIDLSGSAAGGGPPQPAGFIGYPLPPVFPILPAPPTNTIPFNYPPPGGSSSGGGGGGGMSVGGGPSAGGASAPVDAAMESIERSIYPRFFAKPPGGSKDSVDDEEKATSQSLIDTEKTPPPSYAESISASVPAGAHLNKPKPQPRNIFRQDADPASTTLPDLPGVPTEDLPAAPAQDDEEEIDFDALSKRFDALKKKK